MSTSEMMATATTAATTAIKDNPQAVAKCIVSSASSLSVHALATDEWVGTFARALKGEDTTSVMRTVGDDALLMLWTASPTAMVERRLPSTAIHLHSATSDLRWLFMEAAGRRCGRPVRECSHASMAK